MGGLFGTKPKMEPVKEQPDPNDALVEAAKRRRAALAQQQSGQRSANLTRPGTKETLGG